MILSPILTCILRFGVFSLEPLISNPPISMNRPPVFPVPIYQMNPWPLTSLDTPFVTHSSTTLTRLLNILTATDSE